MRVLALLAIPLVLCGHALAQQPDLAATKARAEAGEAAAQLSLGRALLNGAGLAKDPAEGAKWVAKSADQGFADAQALLGLLYERGIGVAKDDRLSLQWMQKGADGGNRAALGAIGDRYFHAEGVPPSLEVAALWFTLAAELGDLTAQRELGMLSTQGIDLVSGSINLARAYKRWLRIAAERGDPTAQVYLAYQLSRQVNAAQLGPEIYKWLRLGLPKIEKERAAAPADLLKKTEARLTPQERASAEQMIAAWRPALFGKAELAVRAAELKVNFDLGLRSQADAGDPLALYLLGEYELLGLFVGKDSEALRSGVQHLLASAKAGHASAQKLYAALLLGGVGVAPDRKESAAWLARCAEQGDQQAQVILGVLLLEGRVFPADAPAAAKLLEGAAQKGHAEAQYFLGTLYENGTVFPKDRALATEWYGRAAAKNHPLAKDKLYAPR